MTTLTPTASPLHDPAGRERVLWVIAAIAILVPAGWFAEFNPATLWGDASLRATRQFLVSFFPPRLDAEFLQLVAVSTWKTIAIATVGTTLAWA